MKQKTITLQQTAILLLGSFLFFIVFNSLYIHIKSPTLSLVSIIFVCIVAWSRGTPAGLTLCFFNTIWISFSIHLHADIQGIPPGKDALIGSIMHIVFTLAAGYMGNLNRRLNDEIDERKRIEALLNEHQNELEKRVDERTLELKNVTQKLHQAEKMETLGQLAGGIAHDFRNHLTIIIGFGTLLLKKLPEKSQEMEFLRQMLNSSDRARELTTNLMNFARKERYKPQQLDINEVVTQTVALFSKSFSSNITIHCSTSPNLPIVLGGKTQIQNAILNLALNSKDALPEKGSISIETKKVTITDHYCSENCITCKPGTFVGISVSDNGCGITPEIMPHIFEPFFTTKPEGRGTGMGLATIQGMTRQHNGDVFAESEPGKDTSFTMLFPASP